MDMRGDGERGIAPKSAIHASHDDANLARLTGPAPQRAF